MSRELASSLKNERDGKGGGASDLVWFGLVRFGQVWEGNKGGSGKGESRWMEKGKGITVGGGRAGSYAKLKTGETACERGRRRSDGQGVGMSATQDRPRDETRWEGVRRHRSRN